MGIEFGKRLSFLRHAAGMENERRVYSEALWPKRVLASVVFVAYPLRRYWGKDQSEVIESGAVGVLSAYSLLIQAYDRYLDTTAILPSLAEIKNNPTLNQVAEEVVRQVGNTRLGREQQRDLIRLVNKSRYSLYQTERDFSQRELSSPEAFEWKKATGGTLLSSATAIFDRCLSIGVEAAKVEQSAFWYGANIQLLDDLVDAGADVLARRQTPATALLRENGELQTFFDFIKAGRGYSFGRLHHLASLTVSKVEQKRQEYFSRTLDCKLEGYHQVADPSLTPIIFNLYSTLSRPASH